jgi:hypothetical protein
MVAARLKLITVYCRNIWRARMCWPLGDFIDFHVRYILQCTPRCLYLLGTLCSSYTEILTYNVELYTVSGVRLQNCRLGSCQRGGFEDEYRYNKIKCYFTIAKPL